MTKTTPTKPIPEDLEALFAEAPQTTPADLTFLEKALIKLLNDPKFMDDLARELVIENTLRAMEEQKMSHQRAVRKNPVVKESLTTRPPAESVKTQEYHDQKLAKFNKLMARDYPYWW